jgi:ATP-dependent 26S proteasome regulatory subunit
MPNIKSQNSQNSGVENSRSEIGKKIINYIRAGYAGLFLVSPEEQRVEAELKGMALEVGFKLYAWATTTGLVDTEKGAARQANDPMEALLAIQELPEKVIVVLRDFHLFLNGDPNPVLLRQLKDTLQHAKTQNKPLIVLGCRLCLPPELEREMTVVEVSLPGKEELGRVLDGVLESATLASLGEQDREAALDSAAGLTTIEAENAFALSVAESNAIVPTIIAREKAHAVKKNGLLEIIETQESLDSIGGLDVLKDWLLKRRNAFGKKARAYGLPVPKGLLIIGIPGTGKSLTAKATASVFGVPLLRLDAGRIFAGLVGQSEYNLRSVIQTAEAIAPCVLWLDEIEKGMAGSKSSGSTDGGTSARVLSTFLAWMQEKTAPVFVVATANDVSQLPPEMLRSGRWDQLFFVDLPNETERDAIWSIQISKHSRDPKDFDIRQLAKATDGLTGSEVEAVFVEALYQAFDDDKEPTDLTIARVLTEFVPLSKTMAEQITGLRNWAKGRARFATMPIVESKLRRLAA